MSSERNHQRKYDVTRKMMEKIMDENELFATYEQKFTIRASVVARIQIELCGCKSKSSVHEQTKKQNIRTMQ